MKAHVAFLFSVVLLAVICIAKASPDGATGGDSDNCRLFGGKCLARGSCKLQMPEENRFSCGANQECCYTEPDPNKRCKGMGGECINNCPENIQELGAKATDCEKGLHCCIWL